MNHAFLYISFPALHDYDVKMPTFTVEHKIYLFIYCPLEFNSKKTLSAFDELNEMW